MRNVGSEIGALRFFLFRRYGCAPAGSLGKNFHSWPDAGLSIHNDLIGRADACVHDSLSLNQTAHRNLAILSNVIFADDEHISLPLIGANAGFGYQERGMLVGTGVCLAGRHAPRPAPTRVYEDL